MAHKGSVGVGRRISSYIPSYNQIRTSTLYAIRIGFVGAAYGVSRLDLSQIKRVDDCARQRPVATYQQYYASGVVKEQGVPVARSIRVCRRDTGAVLATGASDGTGAFILRWRGYSGLIYLLFFDDTAVGPDYNCKVYDLLTGAI